jgi:hypothetical protein
LYLYIIYIYTYTCKYKKRLPVELYIRYQNYMIYIVTWLARALLGNGPFNTSRPNTQGNNRRMAVSMQRPANNLQLSELLQ